MRQTIRGLEFARIRVGERTYEYDVVIYPDGRVVRRPKHYSKPYADRYGHTPLSGEELEAIIGEADEFDALVVGTGLYGSMPLTNDARRIIEALREKGVLVVVEKSPAAVEEYNRLVEEGRRVLAIIHTTC